MVEENRGTYLYAVVNEYDVFQGFVRTSGKSVKEIRKKARVKAKACGLKIHGVAIVDKALR